MTPSASLQHHPLSAFHQLYQQQMMWSEMSQAEKDVVRRSSMGREHDDSRGEGDDDRSRSPDSPTQLTGEDTADDDQSATLQPCSPAAANKCK